MPPKRTPMHRMVGIAATSGHARALTVRWLPRRERFKFCGNGAAVPVCVAGGMPARCRELAGLVSRFASAIGPALPLDPRLMPLELLLALGEPPAQMPLYPLRKPLGFEAGSLFAQLHQRSRPAAVVPVQASGLAAKPACRITGAFAAFHTCSRASGKDRIEGEQSDKNRGSKMP